jgi:hypothetical protein
MVGVDPACGSDYTVCAVALSYEEVRLARVPLATLLRVRGIDPDRPYAQRDVPTMQAHIYIQRIPSADAEGQAHG